MLCILPRIFSFLTDVEFYSVSRVESYWYGVQLADMGKAFYAARIAEYPAWESTKDLPPSRATLLATIRHSIAYVIKEVPSYRFGSPILLKPGDAEFIARAMEGVLPLRPYFWIVAKNIRSHKAQEAPFMKKHKAVKRERRVAKIPQRSTVLHKRARRCVCPSPLNFVDVRKMRFGDSLLPMCVPAPVAACSCDRGGHIVFTVIKN